MRMLRMFIATALIVVLAVASPAAALERHVVTSDALAQAVAQHVAEQDTQRAAIHQALARPEVQKVAAAAGIDLSKVAASVDMLSADALTQAATQARQVNDSLVGGASTITISTTTIIIVLLVVILILVID